MNGGMDMSDLLTKKCIPCSIGTDPLAEDEIQVYYKELQEGWKVVDNHHIEKSYKFKDFQEALDFTNKVGALAEAEGHHPDIYLSWGKVDIKIYTHKIDGLHENDFILAAKIDEL